MLEPRRRKICQPPKQSWYQALKPLHHLPAKFFTAVSSCLDLEGMVQSFTIAVKSCLCVQSCLTAGDSEPVSLAVSSLALAT